MQKFDKPGEHIILCSIDPMKDGLRGEAALRIVRRNLKNERVARVEERA